jgi:Bacterial membrane protein YfhO
MASSIVQPRRRTTGARRPPRVAIPYWKPALCLILLALAVIIVYFPIRTQPGDNTLAGVDYLVLHRYRIAFAQEALFGSHPHLPGWYPRDLLGTPFWSNIQNFPLLPTRLAILAFDPMSAYAIGVILAAELSGLFTYLYARAIGLEYVGAAAAAWTFACSGFFASRVLSGQLPLLEAYPALPLLLWLVHRCAAAPAGRRAWTLRALGGATAVVCLAGHPQLPAYAIVAAAAYAVWMNFRRPEAARGSTLRTLAAIGLGVGAAAFVLWPMAQLVGRSNRFLPVSHVIIDVAFPWRRLLAFVLPWHDGWPPNVLGPPSPPTQFGDRSVFWETVCYVGVLPIAAAGFWLASNAWRRKLPRGAWGFLAAMGMAALLLALPPMHDAMAHFSGTVFRSPARLLYLMLFALSFPLGAVVDHLLTHSGGKAWIVAAAAVLLAIQFGDLGHHDRAFIETIQLPPDDGLTDRIRQAAGSGRATVDHAITISYFCEVDDVGFYDSIALLKPFAALVDLGHLSPGSCIQSFDGSLLTPRALRLCGVRAIVTDKLRSPTDDSPPQVYALKGSADRVEFFPMTSSVIAELPAIHAYLRDPDYDLTDRLLIPAGSPAPAAATQTTPEPASATIGYTRDSEDRMTVVADIHEPGYLRISEAWDPGWHATVDGQPAPLLAGDDLFLTLPISPGSHQVQLAFSTPGVLGGWAITTLSLIALWAVTRNEQSPSISLPA